MNTKVFLLTIAVLLQSSVLMAGPIIKGKVVDASTGEEIIGVTVLLKGSVDRWAVTGLDGSDIDYIVNTSGSLSREVEPIEGTVFCSPESGWSLVTVSADTLCLHMLDKNGQVLHTVTRTK